MYNQFQLSILSTEEQLRGIRSRKTIRSRETAIGSGIKRIFRLGGESQSGRR